MAQVYRLKPDASVTDLGTVGYNPVGTVYDHSAEFDNSTGLWQGAYFYWDVSAPVASGDWANVFMRISVDGTNFNDDINTQRQTFQIASLKRSAAAVAQKHTFHVPKLPPCKFTIVISSGAYATTGTLYILPYTTEIASA